VNTFTTREMKVPVPVKLNWYRVHGNRGYKLKSVKGNTYQLTALDIGCSIKVIIIPMDSDFKGQAKITFQKVSVEASVRMTLENILTVRTAKFPIQVLDHQGLKDDGNSSLVITP